jgi:hypothetical protein
MNVIAAARLGSIRNTKFRTRGSDVESEYTDDREVTHNAKQLYQIRCMNSSKSRSYPALPSSAKEVW